MKNIDFDWIFVIGIFGLLYVVDLILVIKYGYVKVICDECGIVVDFKVDNDYLCYGNNDDCVDDIVKWLVKELYSKMNMYYFYWNVKFLIFVLMIIFNVVYGKNIGIMLNGC